MGQRTQLLTFNGSVYITHRIEINSSNGIPVLIRTKNQELSGSVSTDFLEIRDDSSINNNGHFSVTSE